MIRLAGLRPERDIAIELSACAPARSSTKNYSTRPNRRCRRPISALRLAAPRTADYAVMARSIDELEDHTRPPRRASARAPGSAGAQYRRSAPGPPPPPRRACNPSAGRPVSAASAPVPARKSSRHLLIADPRAFGGRTLRGDSPEITDALGRNRAASSALSTHSATVLSPKLLVRPSRWRRKTWLSELSVRLWTKEPSILTVSTARACKCRSEACRRQGLERDAASGLSQRVDEPGRLFDVVRCRGFGDFNDKAAREIRSSLQERDQ